MLVVMYRPTASDKTAVEQHRIKQKTPKLFGDDAEFASQVILVTHLKKRSSGYDIGQRTSE